MKKTILILIAIILLLPSCIELPPVGLPSTPQDGTGGTGGTVSSGGVGDNGTSTAETVNVPFKDRYFEEWYLSDPTDWDANILFTPSDSAEYNTTNAVYVKLPVVYEQEQDGLSVKVEFFKEIYTYHSFIQTRLTVTNHTGYKIVYDGTDPYVYGVFVSESSYIHLGRSQHDIPFDCDVVRNVVLENGESYVNEGTYWVDDSFVPEKEYTFKLELPLYIDKSSDPKTYDFSFPVEVCAPSAG